MTQPPIFFLSNSKHSEKNLVSETEDRIRHVEMLNLFLENLFPADSNVTEYGYEFEKNIFKTQAAKSYIYPS